MHRSTVFSWRYRWVTDQHPFRWVKLLPFRQHDKITCPHFVSPEARDCRMAGVQIACFPHVKIGERDEDRLCWSQILFLNKYQFEQRIWVRPHIKPSAWVESIVLPIFWVCYDRSHCPSVMPIVWYIGTRGFIASPTDWATGPLADEFKFRDFLQHARWFGNVLQHTRRYERRIQCDVV